MSVSLVELSEKHQPSSSLANLLFNNTMLKCSGAQQRNTASRTSLVALWLWHPPVWHHTFWWTLKWYYSRARSHARHHTNPDWGRGHHRLAHRLPQSGAQWENNPVWGRKAEQQVQRQPGSTQWVGGGKTFYSRFIFYSTVNPKDYYKCPRQYLVLCTHVQTGPMCRAHHSSLN